MPDLLRKIGLRIVCHSEKFDDDMTPDPVWIELCGKEDFIVITADKGLETDPVNRKAVIDHKAKVFILDENNSRAMDWASAIIVSRRRIIDVAHENVGPFFSSIRKQTPALVTKIRIP